MGVGGMVWVRLVDTNRCANRGFSGRQPSVQEEGSYSGVVCQESLVKSPRPHAPSFSEEFLRTPQLDPSTPPNSVLSQAIRNPRRVRIYIPSRQNSHLPVPVHSGRSKPDRASNLIARGSKRCYFLSRISMATLHMCSCSKAQHMRLPPPQNRHVVLSMFADKSNAALN